MKYVGYLSHRWARQYWRIHTCHGCEFLDLCVFSTYHLFCWYRVFLLDLCLQKICLFFPSEAQLCLISPKMPYILISGSLGPSHQPLSSSCFTDADSGELRGRPNTVDNLWFLLLGNERNTWKKHVCFPYYNTKYTTLTLGKICHSAGYYKNVFSFYWQIVLDWKITLITE